MVLISRFKKLLSNDFLKNITVLITGTSIAQALAIAASPVLSRLFDPGAFGILGMFVAFTAVISVVASAKYELAILLPKEDEKAANILGLSLIILFFVSLASFLAVLFFRYEIAVAIGSKDLAPLLWWAPVSIVFTGLFNIFNFWNTRSKRYKNLAASRVIQSSCRESTQLAFGFFSQLQAAGLVFGNVFGQFASAISLMVKSLLNDGRFIRKSINLKGIKEQAKAYNYFPKYSTPQNLLNSISQNVPAVLLAFFFNPAIAGLYWFTHKILVAPNHLIGTAVRQVFYQRANEIVNAGDSPFNLFFKTTRGLLFIGIAPLIAVLIAGPVMFSFIFGAEWREAGIYAQWLIIWWLAGFVNPPAVMMIPILSLQKFQLLFEVVVIILRIAAIAIGGYLNSPLIAIMLFSITGFLANAFLIAYIYVKCKPQRTDG